MRYEDRYTDDTHGMAEPSSLLPTKKTRLEVEQVGVHRDPFADAKAAVDREDARTAEDLEDDQRRYELEKAYIRAAKRKLMGEACGLLAGLMAQFEAGSHRNITIADLISENPDLFARVRVAERNGYSDSVMLAIYRDQHGLGPHMTREEARTASIPV